MGTIEARITDLVGTFLTVQNVGAALAIWVFLHLIARVFPEIFHKGFFKRILPLLPEALGICAMYIPGMSGGSTSNRIITGIFIGLTASKMHKILGQSVFGLDDDISTPKIEKIKGEKFVPTATSEEVTKPELPPAEKK